MLQPPGQMDNYTLIAATKLRSGIDVLVYNPVKELWGDSFANHSGILLACVKSSNGELMGVVRCRV